jgi:hypothetical protein
MKMCSPHWEMLRAAIKDRGLSALVADSGQQAVSNMESEMRDGPTIDNFDPLMGAHWAIVSNLSVNHPSILFVDDCPLCYANRGHAQGCNDPGCTEREAYYDRWIQRAADDQVSAWKARGDRS